MNKRTVLASLNKIANELDNNGLYAEASAITKVMKKLAIDREDKVGRTFAELFDALDGLLRPMGGGTNDVPDEAAKHGVNPQNPDRESMESFIDEIEKQGEKIPGFFSERVNVMGKEMTFSGIRGMLMNLTKDVPSYTTKYKDPSQMDDMDDM